MRNSTDRAAEESDVLVQAVLEADADRCANQIVQAATITLLVEAGVITASQAIERIEALTPFMAHAHLAQDIDQRLKRVIAQLGGESRARPKGWRPTVIEGGRGSR